MRRTLLVLCLPLLLGVSCGIIDRWHTEVGQAEDGGPAYAAVGVGGQLGDLWEPLRGERLSDTALSETLRDIGDAIRGIQVSVVGLEERLSDLEADSDQSLDELLAGGAGGGGIGGAALLAYWLSQRRRKQGDQGDG